MTSARTKWTPVRVKQFSDAWKEGRTLNEIAGLFDISVHTAEKKRAELKLKPRTQTFKNTWVWTKQKDDKLKELIEQRLNPAQIAEVMGCTAYRVERRVSRLQLKRPPPPIIRDDSADRLAATLNVPLDRAEWLIKVFGCEAIRMRRTIQ